MPERFAICCNRRELLLIALFEDAEQPRREGFAVLEQTLECNCTGDRTLVEEDRDFTAGWQFLHVGPPCVHVAAAHILPPAAQRTRARGLVRSQDRETDSKLREHV